MSSNSSGFRSKITSRSRSTALLEAVERERLVALEPEPLELLQLRDHIEPEQLGQRLA